jgi:hypothetical protein
MGQTAVAAGLPVAKITAKVIYEDGSPVERITVNAGFSLPYNAWADSYKGYSKSARTNKDGNASFEGRTASGISLGIREEGYYRTTNGLPYLFNEIKDGKWQPWNPAVEMVLKPILKPIPMYAKRVETKIPVIGETVGFDLVASDWIAPHGKGKIADFIIKMKKQYMSVNQPFEVTLTMCFSNEDDGIQSLLAPINVGSELRLPRYAPENGYMPELVKSNSRKSVNAMIERDYRDDQNYFFRVRTVKKNGKIISAYYGKIDGDIEFWGNEKLRFTYYLNPTPNDRNMEFDPKRNLLTGLKDDEAVFNP